MTFLLLLLSCSQEINDPGYIPGAPNPYSNTPPPKLSVILDGNIPTEDLAVICDQETIPHQKTDKATVIEFDIDPARDSCILMRKKERLIEVPIYGKVWCDQKEESIVCIK